MGGWVDGWMGGWVDGWMGGWVDGWSGSLTINIPPRPYLLTPHPSPLTPHPSPLPIRRFPHNRPNILHRGGNIARIHEHDFAAVTGADLGAHLDIVLRH